MLIFMPGLFVYFLYYPLVKYMQNQVTKIRKNILGKAILSLLNYHNVSFQIKHMLAFIALSFFAEHCFAKYSTVYCAERGECCSTLHFGYRVSIWNCVGISHFLITARKRSLRLGNIFTSVCHSFYPWGVYPCMQWAGEGVCIPACNGVCLPLGPKGVPQGVYPLPPRRPLKRAVRILLECILVIRCGCI